MPLGDTTRMHHQLCCCGNGKIHNILSETDELLPVQRFGHIIALHEVSWAVLNLNIILCLLICDKEESDV